MNKKTLVALKECIKKYKAAKVGKEIILGTDDCALCGIYNHGFNPCIGCPIMKKTKKWGCHDTPYYDLMNSSRQLSACDYAITKESFPYVKEEIKFLESLLPKKPRVKIKRKGST